MVDLSKGNAVEFPEYVRLAADDRIVGTVIKTDAELRSFTVEWADGGTSIELLDDAGEGWIACLARAKAEASLEVVKTYIDQKYDPGWEPKLYAPGHEGPFWNISLEGVGDWAIRIGGYDETPFPEGVFAEPGTDWYLALYPTS